MSTAAPFDLERYAHRLAPLGAILAVGGGCLGGWPGMLVAVVGFALLIASCYSARDGLLILGPAAWFELIRGSRRRWRVWWRCLYVLGALAALGLTLQASVRSPHSVLSFEPLVTSGRGELARAAAAFFAMYSVVQFIFLVYLTIQLVAPIVAEEREAKRWDVLLTTDLRAREILLGKLAGRLPRIVEPVLATLPLLALLPLFGGVSPVLVLAVGAVTVAAILGTTGVAFFYSVFSPTAKRANERTAGFLAAYCVLSPMLYFGMADPRVWNFPSNLGLGTSPVEVSDLVDVVNAGNPFSAMSMAGYRAGLGGNVEDEFFRAGGRFVVFQLGLLAAFGLLAAARLRSATPWEGPSAAVVKATAAGKARSAAVRPPVGDWPIYWWERFGALNRGQLWFVNRMTWRGTLAVCFGAVLIFIWVNALDRMWPWGRGHVTSIVQVTLMVGGAIMGVMFTLIPTVQAAQSMVRERVADTLEGIRLTALTSRDILFEKWAACVMAPWPLFKMMLAIIVAGIVTRQIPPAVLPVVIGSSLLLTPVLAAIGIFFSVHFRTPGKAVGVMMFCGFVASQTFPLVVLFLAEIVRPAVLTSKWVTVIVPPSGYHLFGVTLRTSDFVAIIGLVIGLAVWFGIGWLAWKLAVRRFEAERQN